MTWRTEPGAGWFCCFLLPDREAGHACYRSLNYDQWEVVAGDDVAFRGNKGTDEVDDLCLVSRRGADDVAA